MREHWLVCFGPCVWSSLGMKTDMVHSIWLLALVAVFVLRLMLQGPTEALLSKNRRLQDKCRIEGSLGRPESHAVRRKEMQEAVKDMVAALGLASA